MEIKKVDAWEILDSRGRPTISVTVELTDNSYGMFMVPSGASVGSNEALELRDGDMARYHGQGVLKAINNVRTIIAPAICGQQFAKQSELDLALCRLDGTGNKEKLGANAILGVSIAYARAMAQSKGMPLYECLGAKNILPTPLFNIINGGVHARNSLAIQEFMVVPHGASSFKEALRWGAEIYRVLAIKLAKMGLSTAVGDEGGFAPADISHTDALELIVAAIRGAGYIPGQQVSLALDCAATEFRREDGLYYLQENKPLDSYEWSQVLHQWITQYPIISVEDPLAEDDWEGWQQLRNILPRDVQVVGDDLFVTQVDYLTRGVNENIANAILIKPNQVGTLTQTLEVLDLADQVNYARIISHRSGETEDAFIADLAVGSGSGQIKAGAPCRSERLAKYNRLVQIERDLGSRAVYAGLQGFGTNSLD